MHPLPAREAELLAHLRLLSPRGILLAFSGGVDSTLLLAALARLHAEAPFPVLAVTFTSPLHPPEETQEAAALAARFRLPHRILAVDPLSLPTLSTNPPNRCYLCKRALFARLRALAEECGLSHILEGTHAGDTTAWRPGRQALQELAILSPLATLGFDKAAIRALAAQWGLPTARKPSAPCLATRFPYGTPLTPEGLRRVAQAERLLRQSLPPETPCRLRDHGSLARIEVPPAHFPTLLAAAETLHPALRALGYAFITLDLAGFRSGSYDAPPRQPESPSCE